MNKFSVLCGLSKMLPGHQKCRASLSNPGEQNWILFLYVLLGQLQLFLSLGPKAGERFLQSTGPNRVSSGLKTLLGSPTVQGLWTMVSADFKVAVLRFEVYVYATWCKHLPGSRNILKISLSRDGQIWCSVCKPVMWLSFCLLSDLFLLLSWYHLITLFI